MLSESSRKKQKRCARLLACRPPEIPWLTTQIISVRAPSKQTVRHGPSALPRGRWTPRSSAALAAAFHARAAGDHWAARAKKAQKARQLRTSAPLAKNA